MGVFIWLVFSILCAFFLSITDLLTKKYSDIINVTEIAFGRIFFSIPILWFFSIIDGIPQINYKLLWVYLFALPLELFSLFLYIRALKLSPLSLTVPFLSFTPAFLLITSPIMLGEYPSLNGILGIFFIVAGAYFLNLSSSKMGLLFPLKMITNEKGSLLMLIVSFIYSITSNFSKVGVINSSPTFFAASYFSLLAFILFFIARKKGLWRSLFRGELLIIGLCSGLMITFHIMAIKLSYVSYMIAIKRSSLLFGIFFGILIFKERKLNEKLIGGIIMIFGMLVISFSS